MSWQRTIPGFAVSAIAWAWAGAALAEPLTADRAVQIALERSTQIINANADVLAARGSLYSAYSGVLPRLSAGYTRFGSTVDHSSSSGLQLIGGTLTPVTLVTDVETHGTTPTVSGSWTVFSLSNLSGLSSARQGTKAARFGRNATRSDVALATRRQFYEVVRAVRLQDVATNALTLARDDERRVRALFEVGSVSRSDVLQAQVRTAQSELDSLTARQNAIVQRIALANQLGIKEAEVGEVDTTLTVALRTVDEAALLEEAGRNRPDLRAAEAEYAAARAGVTSARTLRLPYVTVSGSAELNTDARRTTTINEGTPSSSTNETDRNLSGQVALNWDFFDGLATDGRVATARARLLRSRESRDALRRGLEGEVHEAVLIYQEALARQRVATRAFDAATENVKLTQQKYNVGSATTLELINAQIQLQRAESDQVSALAAIRVAEAQLDRVRGRSE